MHYYVREAYLIWHTNSLFQLREIYFVRV